MEEGSQYEQSLNSLEFGQCHLRLKDIFLNILLRMLLGEELQKNNTGRDLGWSLNFPSVMLNGMFHSILFLRDICLIYSLKPSTNSDFTASLHILLSS